MRVGGALIFSRGLVAANFDTYYIFVEHSVIQFYDVLSNSGEFCFNTRVNTETREKNCLSPKPRGKNSYTPLLRILKGFVA